MISVLHFHSYCCCVFAYVEQLHVPLPNVIVTTDITSGVPFQPKPSCGSVISALVPCPFYILNYFFQGRENDGRGKDKWQRMVREAFIIGTLEWDKET